MNKSKSRYINRRQFMAGSATACLSFFLPFQVKGDNTKPAASAAKLHAWVTLHSDNRITIFSPAAEMGQGSMTSIPMIFAEEFDADWNQVHIKTSPTDVEHFKNPTNWVQGAMLTLGSSAVSGYYDTARRFGAQARRVLLDTAASFWQVPLASLTTTPSRVNHTPSGQSLSYGELVSLVKTDIPLVDSAQLSLKAEKDFRIIGSHLPRYDIPAKVTGQAQYSIDVDLENMAYATVIHCPLRGGTPARISNEVLIKQKFPKVSILKLPDGIALVADSYDPVLRASRMLDVKWKNTEDLQTFNDPAALRQHHALARNNKRRGFVVQQKGDTSKAFAQAHKVWQAEFSCDYLYHGQLEPLNAVARVANDSRSAEIWVGTQAPGYCVDAVAAELDTSKENITLHRTYLGGGFGRRGARDHDFVIDAVRLAKQLKRPVKVIWSREEDIKNGRFKPLKAVLLRVAENRQRQLIGWHHRTISDEALQQSDPQRYKNSGNWPGLSAIGLAVDYSIANVTAEVLDPKTGVRIAPMRGTGAIANKFATESLIDEIALDQEQDPLAFRLKLLKHQPIAQQVLRTAAKMADWPNRKSNSGMGLAFESAEFPTAFVVQVALETRSHHLRIQRVWAALDVGVAVHPDNIHAQMEGQIIYALSNILRERISFTAGEVQQTNFFDYPIMRIDEVPEIEVNLLTREGAQPSGVGDSRLGAIPAAVTNAFFDLTGKRMRHLPLLPERVKAALES